MSLFFFGGNFVSGADSSRIILEFRSQKRAVTIHTYLFIKTTLGEFGNNKSFIISDETVLMELRPWQREVLKFSKEIIGTVKTSLVGDRSEESTLGNFVTDAIVNYVST